MLLLRLCSCIFVDVVVLLLMEVRCVVIKTACVVVYLLML